MLIILLSSLQNPGKACISMSLKKMEAIQLTWLTATGRLAKSLIWSPASRMVTFKSSITIPWPNQSARQTSKVGLASISKQATIASLSNLKKALLIIAKYGSIHSQSTENVEEIKTNFTIILTFGIEEKQSLKFKMTWSKLLHSKNCIQNLFLNLLFYFT
jgi:hypothetical protein